MDIENEIEVYNFRLQWLEKRSEDLKKRIKAYEAYWNRKS